MSSEEGNRLIGSDPEEWLSGSAVAGFLRGEAERSGGNVSSVSSETEVYEEGTVGWATARLTLSVPNGAYVTPRWSAVLRKEGDVGGSSRRMPRSRSRTTRSVGNTPG